MTQITCKLYRKFKNKTMAVYCDLDRFFDRFVVGVLVPDKHAWSSVTALQR